MSNGIILGEHLEITVLCCYNLRDTSRGIHPYVRLEYVNSSYRTQVCKAQAKDPVFGQKCELPFLEGHHEIGVAVWNKNTMQSDNLIGTARVLIDIALLGGSDDSVWPLQFEDRPAGQIRLIMKYQKRHTMGNMLRLSADFGHLQPVPYREIYAPTSYVPTFMYPIIPPLPPPPDPVVIPSLTSISIAHSPSAPSARSLTYNSASLSAPNLHSSYGLPSPDLLKRPASLNSSSYVAPSEPPLYGPPAPELHSPPASLNPSSYVAPSEPSSYIPPSTESVNQPTASLNSSSCVASSEPSSNSSPTPELLNGTELLNSLTSVASSEPKSYSPPALESEPSKNPPSRHFRRQAVSLDSSSEVAATYQDDGDGSKEVQIWDSSSIRSKPLVRKRVRSYSKSDATSPLVSNVSSYCIGPNLSVGRKVFLFVACLVFWVLIYYIVGNRFKWFALFR